jgi:hypothetical protein
MRTVVEYRNCTTFNYSDTAAVDPIDSGYRVIDGADADKSAASIGVEALFLVTRRREIATRPHPWIRAKGSRLDGTRREAL